MTRASRTSAALAAVACGACCAAPLLVTAGVLTSAGAALLTNVLIGLTLVLVLTAAILWRRHRTAAAGCDGDDCSCEKA